MILPSRMIWARVSSASVEYDAPLSIGMDATVAVDEANEDDGGMMVGVTVKTVDVDAGIDIDVGVVVVDTGRVASGGKMGNSVGVRVSVGVGVIFSTTACVTVGVGIFGGVSLEFNHPHPPMSNNTINPPPIIRGILPIGLLPPNWSLLTAFSRSPAFA